MSANRWGNLFQLTSFGESHGPAIGALIEGCPSGVRFQEELLKLRLERRRPGGKLVSSRQEPDHPEVLSGVYEGKTLGTPIAVTVRNVDMRSEDYKSITSPRIGHADDVWVEKFGHADPRGGGRSSGRETIARVIGGAIAEMFLNQTVPDLKVWTTLRQIGDLKIPKSESLFGVNDLNVSEDRYRRIAKLLEELKLQGDSVGGIVELRVQNTPKNLGQPVFHKLKADLASAFMSIGATIGVELGDGFELAEVRGTNLHTTAFNSSYGGIRGGISTGEDLIFRVAFKPTSSILDVAKKGRHDPCIVIRAMPVIEAMTFLVLADHLLWTRLDHL